MSNTTPLGVTWLRTSLKPTLRALNRVRRDEPAFLSFNVADRCPVNCDCYWRAQARVKELDDDDVVAFFEARRDEGYVHATLIGGEPYVRPKLLERITPILPWNWVVTSGTVPLRQLPNTVHFVSVDGATADTHDTIRGTPGLHARLVRNLEHARAAGDFPAYIHTVLNAANHRELPQIIDGWKQSGLADGVIVSTMTPIADAGDEKLRLTRDQRESIVRELHRLRKEHPDFLVMTAGMVDSLHPDATALRTPDSCGTARAVASFDAAGKRIPQCILSDKADCSQCGCIITAWTEPLTKPAWRRPPQDWATLTRLASM